MVGKNNRPKRKNRTENLAWLAACKLTTDDSEDNACPGPWIQTLKHHSAVSFIPIRPVIFCPCAKPREILQNLIAVSHALRLLIPQALLSKLVSFYNTRS